MTGAVIPPLSLSTTFKQVSPGEPMAGMDYSRSGNPSRKNFEEAIAALEGGKHGLAFASGSATTATIINMFKAGDHFISVNDVYGGTNRYFNRVAAPIGFHSTFVDMSDLKNVEAAFRPNTKMVWIETPTNPTLRLVDIKALAAIVKRHPGTILVVDNTFLSPYFQNPLSLGADIVVHSVTKYLNGHSDVVMGVAVTSNSELYEKLKFLQNGTPAIQPHTHPRPPITPSLSLSFSQAIGAVPSPFDCFLANRGLKTLHIRMEKHQENAFIVANFLESSPFCTEVIYPGLASHPQHELAKRQQSGFGGMISFRIKGDLSNAKRFFQHIKYFTLAESLGGIESLSEIP